MVAIQEILRVLIETWILCRPSLTCMIFDGEVGYEFPVSGMTNEQRALYGPWI